MDAIDLGKGKYIGTSLEIANYGRLQLTQIHAMGVETAVYRTDHPNIIVKMFDLSCWKADEFSYGPYMSFSLELENIDDVQKIAELKHYVPAYYGANIDYDRKYAYIAMEYLQGVNLKTWCEAAAADGYPDEWVGQFREAFYEALFIMRLFHRHGIILIDFKPENIIRLLDNQIKFVDLGALYTPRHLDKLQQYVYSATPDYAEVIIDASNVQSGVPPGEATDIFAAGVALFEMATDASRAQIDGRTADDILSNPSIYLFRESQIKDVWHAYPNLNSVLPLVETQLRERRILFSELWYLLKGYVMDRLPDWETLAKEQQDQIILSTGTTFIMEQLPPQLQWLAGLIAQATALRSMRLKSVGELVKLMGQPAPAEVIEDIEHHNELVQFLRDLEKPVEFVRQLNCWEVRLNPRTGHWAVAAVRASAHLLDNAQYAFLKQDGLDDQGHRFYHLVGDREADDYEGGKLTLGDLKGDHYAWIGSPPA